MVQKEKKSHEDQVFYEGKWVDRKFFRTFVFNLKDEMRLANSYEEYERLIASGLWFSEKSVPVVIPIVPQGKRKTKDGAIRTAS